MIFWPWHITLAIAIFVSIQAGFLGGIKGVPAEYGRIAFLISANLAVVGWIVWAARHDRFLRGVTPVLATFMMGLVTVYALSDPNAGEGVALWSRILTTSFVALMVTFTVVMIVRRPEAREH